MTSPPDFVDVVAASHGLVVTRGDAHACRLEPHSSDLVWFCDLDDGTSTNSERDPASFVRWVCPDLRLGGSPAVEVRRTGPRSDLGKLLSRFTGRASDDRFVYDDPSGVIDPGIRVRIEDWPAARHGDGTWRPAELSSIRLTGEGLVVESVSWWDSAPALDHQIGLGVDLARRLIAHRM